MIGCLMTKDSLILFIVLSLIVILFVLTFFNFLAIVNLSKQSDLLSCVRELRRSEVALEQAADGLCRANEIANIWQENAERCCKKEK